MHFLPFAGRKTKISIFQANIYKISHIFENVDVIYQLIAIIECISNCNIITDITRLCFDIWKTFRILLLQMVSAYRPFCKMEKEISRNYNKNNNDISNSYVK